MRPLLLCLIAACLVTGCGCSETGIEGSPDSSIDPNEDLAVEPDAVDVPEEENPPTGECVNGIVETGEECDDGDLNDCNGCSAACTWERAMHITGGEVGASIEGDSPPCLPDFYTLEMWVRFDEEMRGRSCVLYVQSYGIQIQVGFEDEILVSVETACPDLLDSIPAAPGTWHHIAVVFGPDDSLPYSLRSRKTYVDGIPIELFYASSYGPPWTCDFPSYIGYNRVCTPSCWPISEAGCYLTIDDVRMSEGMLYVGEFTPPPRLDADPGTVMLIDFDTDADGVVADASGNDHDAVLVDGTLVPDDCHLP